MRFAVSVSVLAVVAAVPLAAAEAQEAASEETAELSGTYENRTILVSASRSGTELSDLPTSTSVVSEVELAKQLDFNTNIMRALEFTVPGLAPQREARSNCSPNIRGRTTAILINGVPVNENLRQSTCNQMYQLSPFAVGLQTDLVTPNIGAHLNFIASGGASADTPQNCTQVPDIAGRPGVKRLQNGIQIFPGSVPIYRGNTLVGGIGVSGDGIDQDDMVAFLGAHNGGQRAGSIGNAPVAIRADQIVIQVNGNGVRLRYVNCPFAPFLDSAEQNVCQGL